MNGQTLRWSAVVAGVCVAGAAGFALHGLASPDRAWAEQPVKQRADLTQLKGLRVILVLRDDWMNTTTPPQAQQPPVNALYQAKAKLFCRIDDVHGEWVEVSTPRSGDLSANPITTRDIWLIRTDSIVAIQTGEAER